MHPYTDAASSLYFLSKYPLRSNEKLIEQKIIPLNYPTSLKFPAFWGISNKLVINYQKGCMTQMDKFT